MWLVDLINQETIRWENTSPCPMIIFFNLFYALCHAVKVIFSFVPMAARSMDRGSDVIVRKLAKTFLTVAWSSEILNRNMKMWSALISQCVLSSCAQWAFEKSYFSSREGKELKAARNPRLKKRDEKNAKAKVRFICSELTSFRFTIFLQAIICSFYTHY